MDKNEETFNFDLSYLRKSKGLRQKDIAHGGPSNVSKFENRKDMKLSTLIQYLKGIGMGIEIKVYPLGSSSNEKEKITLLKIK
jgi:transcriptional regulator with XRE-family HTH domain